MTPGIPTWPPCQFPVLLAGCTHTYSIANCGLGIEGIVPPAGTLAY